MSVVCLICGKKIEIIKKKMHVSHSTNFSVPVSSNAQQQQQHYHNQQQHTQQQQQQRQISILECDDSGVGGGGGGTTMNDTHHGVGGGGGGSTSTTSVAGGRTITLAHECDTEEQVGSTFYLRYVFTKKYKSAISQFGFLVLFFIILLLYNFP